MVVVSFEISGKHCINELVLVLGEEYCWLFLLELVDRNCELLPGMVFIGPVFSLAFKATFDSLHSARSAPTRKGLILFFGL